MCVPLAVRERVVSMARALYLKNHLTTVFQGYIQSLSRGHRHLSQLSSFPCNKEISNALASHAFIITSSLKKKETHHVHKK